MGTDKHYFIGIGLTDEAKTWAATIQTELENRLSYKSWPHRDDLHVTLKFLGPVSRDKLLEIDKQVAKTNFCHSFSIKVGSLGYFGNPNRPRVLWAAVENQPMLLELQKQVEHVCLTLGYSPEKRPFRPHVTLAKKWNGSDIEENSFHHIQKEHDQYVHMPVKQICLYQIDPQQSPKYTCWKTYELNGGDLDGPTC